MSKLIGKGGTLTKNASSVTGVVSAEFEEVNGGAYGTTQGNLNVVVILDDSNTPERINTVANWVLTPGNASWTITLTNAITESASIPVRRNESVQQTLTIVDYSFASNAIA